MYSQLHPKISVYWIRLWSMTQVVLLLLEYFCRNIIFSMRLIFVLLAVLIISCWEFVLISCLTLRLFTQPPNTADSPGLQVSLTQVFSLSLLMGASEQDDPVLAHLIHTWGGKPTSHKNQIRERQIFTKSCRFWIFFGATVWESTNHWLAIDPMNQGYSKITCTR